MKMTELDESEVRLEEEKESIKSNLHLYLQSITHQSYFGTKLKKELKDKRPE